MFYAKSFTSVSSVCIGCGCGLSADDRDSNAQHRHGAKQQPQHTDHQPDIAQHNSSTGRYDHNPRDYEHANNTIYFNHDYLARNWHNGYALSHAGHAEHGGKRRQSNRWNNGLTIAKSNANYPDRSIPSAMHAGE